MHRLSPKENMIRLIKFQDPEYIPYNLESVKVFKHRDARFFEGNGDPNIQKWTDAWGVRFALADNNFNESGYPVSHPLESLDQLENFNFPDPFAPELFTEAAKQIETVDRREYLVMFSNPGFLFVRSWLLHGMEETFINMLTEPEQYEVLLDKISDYQMTIIKRTLELKPDIILFGDDVATTKALMMAPALWRSMIKTRLKKIIDVCKDSGCIVAMHCCGCVEEIIDDIMEIGVDILNPIQAGANNQSFIKKKAKDKLTLYGGIDAHTVVTGDTDTVAELTRNALRVLGAGGGYIAYTDHDLPFPKENIETIKAVVRKEGGLR